MFSYIYMKILESQPNRYDRGIALVSLGQSERFKAKLVDENAREGFKVVEIGCGTGTMAILAAKKGAQVFGFDVSSAMLDVARKKISAAGLSEKIEIAEMGVSGMDGLPDSSFDLVMSTLVFSELSHDEQAYALKHALRALKPGGRLAIADEAKPRCIFKRLLHGVVRMIMLIITFVLTQTTTKAVENLEGMIEQAGFKIEKTELGSMESFIYVVALKGEK